MKCKYISISILMLLSLSCSEEVKPTPYEYTTIFTGANSKVWKLKFVELAFNGEVAETAKDDCSLDDEFIFYANNEHSLEVTTGRVKCDQEANTLVDTWTYNSATATLTMLYPPLTTDESIPFIVREVKKNKMVLELFLNSDNSAGYRIHFESTEEN